MKKRLLSIIGLSALTASLFTGCGSSGGSSNSGEVTLKVLTHRTDIVDTKLKEIGDKYYEENGVKIEWEGITDYEGVVKTRMNTKDYGDVLNVLPAVTAEELSQFFAPLGTVSELENYNAINDRADGETVYGIANGLGASGIVYNKALLKQAGYDKFPSTLDELYEAAEKLAALEGVVPMAINFKDKWPLSQYDSVATVAYGTPYYYRDMNKIENPFSKGNPHGDVLEILYSFVSKGWVEEDLATTNWEQSKMDMATGKVAMMTLGMWAVPQVQGLSDSPEDISIAPFPTNNSGTLKAEAGPDQYLAVNKNSDHVEEAKAFLMYLVESEYVDNEGLIPTKKDQESNHAVVKDYMDSGVEFMFTDPKERDQVASDLTNNIANGAGIAFWEGSFYQDVLSAGKVSREDFDKAITNLNAKWEQSKKELTN